MKRTNRFFAALLLCAAAATAVSAQAVYRPTDLGKRGTTKDAPRYAQVNWAHPLTRGLVGYWPFLEGGGSIVQNYARPFGSAGLVRPGHWDAFSGQTWVERAAGGVGVEFDNTSGGIGLSTTSPDPGFWHDAYSTGITVVMLVTLEADTNGGAILWEEGGNLEGVSLVYLVGSDTFQFVRTASGGGGCGTGCGAESTSTFTPDANRLIRIGGTLDDSIIEIWIDGVMEDSISASLPASHASGPSLGGLDGSAPSGAHEFGGVVFFAARWNRKLTDNEMRYVLDNPYALLTSGDPEPGVVFATAAPPSRRLMIISELEGREWRRLSPYIHDRWIQFSDLAREAREVQSRSTTVGGP